MGAAETHGIVLPIEAQDLDGDDLLADEELIWIAGQGPKTREGKKRKGSMWSTEWYLPTKVFCSSCLNSRTDGWGMIALLRRKAFARTNLSVHPRHSQ